MVEDELMMLLVEGLLILVLEMVHEGNMAIPVDYLLLLVAVVVLVLVTAQMVVF